MDPVLRSRLLLARLQDHVVNKVHVSPGNEPPYGLVFVGQGDGRTEVLILFGCHGGRNDHPLCPRLLHILLRHWRDRRVRDVGRDRCLRRLSHVAVLDLSPIPQRFAPDDREVLRSVFHGACCSGIGPIRARAVPPVRQGKQCLVPDRLLHREPGIRVGLCFPCEESILDHQVVPFGFG